MNDLSFIQKTLSLDEDDAAVVLDLCAWVEHEVTVERFGYPRDNVMPPPIEERFGDPGFLQRLIAAALDEEVPEQVKRALRAFVDTSI